MELLRWQVGEATVLSIGDVDATPLGKIMSYYYLSHKTIRHLVRHAKAQASFLDVLSWMSRAVEYCPGAGRPFGFTKCELVSPSCSALRFIVSANDSTLPDWSRARQRATSLALLTSRACSRVPRR